MTVQIEMGGAAMPGAVAVELAPDAALAADVEAALAGVTDPQPAPDETVMPSLSVQLEQAQARLAEAEEADVYSRRLGSAENMLALRGLSTASAPRVVEAVQNGASWRGALFIGAGVLPDVLRRPTLLGEA